MPKSATSTSNQEYKKNSTTIFPMRLFHTTDGDIIAQLATQGNKTGYVKSLIRADIAKQKK